MSTIKSLWEVQTGDAIEMMDVETGRTEAVGLVYRIELHDDSAAVSVLYAVNGSIQDLAFTANGAMHIGVR